MNSTDTPPEPTPAAPPEPVDDSDENFVYEIDRQFARAYSYGGLAVIAAVLLFASLAVALFGTETLRMARLWIALVLVFLVGLFVIRIFVVRRAFSLLAKIQSYCLANDLAILPFRDRHTQNGAYQYFASIFDFAERRNIDVQAPGRPEHREPADEAAGDQAADQPQDDAEPPAQDESRP